MFLCKENMSNKLENLIAIEKGGFFMVKIELKDGSVKELESGMSILEIAKNISDVFNEINKGIKLYL